MRVRGRRHNAGLGDNPGTRQAMLSPRGVEKLRQERERITTSSEAHFR